MDTKTKLYNDLLYASKALIVENEKTHKLKNTRVKAGHGRREALKQKNPKVPVPKVPLDFFAIGDSFFEYPLLNNGPWLEETGIVADVQLGSMGNPPSHIEQSTAQPGNHGCAVLGKSRKLHIAITGSQPVAESKHWIARWDSRVDGR
jgi:hypothetical protein